MTRYPHAHAFHQSCARTAHSARVLLVAALTLTALTACTGEYDIGYADGCEDGEYWGWQYGYEEGYECFASNPDPGPPIDGPTLYDEGFDDGYGDCFSPAYLEGYDQGMSDGIKHFGPC